MLNIIPIPTKATELSGKFEITADTTIAIRKGSSGARATAKLFADSIAPATGFALKIIQTDKTRPQQGQILLSSVNAPKKLGNEGYQITVSPEGVSIRAYKAAGLFYGLQSLRQLLPAKLESPTPVKAKWTASCCEIEDIPQFQWRGMHLDTCRHFQDVPTIKRYIDFLAMYKMNTFHWHLTEDQGWRIEIKKHPKLAEISAWRSRSDKRYWTDKKGDRRKHGGIYTHDDIREVLAYAKQRFVTVVPEIEMPGHAQAALAAYPELGCTGGPYKVWTTWGISDEVFCAGNEKVFKFLEDVLEEVFELFPSKYIHIGGDECHKTRWEACPKCQKRIKKEGLKDEKELQSYFISRMEKFINSRGRKIIGWDEILEGGLAPNAAVMSWRSAAGGIKAAKMGHNAVMTPKDFCYLDYRPIANDPETMPGITEVVRPLSQVYRLNPLDQLPKSAHKYILGGQGCLWTEYINNTDELEYMLLPRVAAIAEKLWSPLKNCQWGDFRRRLKNNVKRLDVMNVNYCKDI